MPEQTQTHTDLRHWCAVSFAPPGVMGLYLLAALEVDGQIVDHISQRSLSGHVQRSQDSTAHGGEANHLFMLDPGMSDLQARLIIAVAPDAPGWQAEMADMACEITLEHAAAQGVGKVQHLRLPLENQLDATHMAAVIAVIEIPHDGKAARLLPTGKAGALRQRDYAALTNTLAQD